MAELTKEIEALNKKLAIFRTSKQTADLARQLFSAGNTTWSNYEITSRLRTVMASAGLELPLSLDVSLDLAQAILAGSTVVNGVQAGLSIGQLAKPATAAINLTFGAIDKLGIIPEHLQFHTSEVRNALGAAIAVARVVCTSGMDILADIQLIMSLFEAGQNVAVNWKNHTFVENVASMVLGGPLVGYLIVDGLVGSQQMADQGARAAAAQAKTKWLKDQVTYATARISKYMYATQASDYSPAELKTEAAKLLALMGSEKRDSQGRVSLYPNTPEWVAVENFRRAAAAAFKQKIGDLADLNSPDPTVQYLEPARQEMITLAGGTNSKTVEVPATWYFYPDRLQKKVDTYTPPTPDNPFDLMGDIATISPVAFKSLFADVAKHLPTYDKTFQFGFVSQGLFGAKRATAKEIVQDVIMNSGKMVSDAIIWEYLIKNSHSLIADRVSSNTISVRALSTISMMNGMLGGPNTSIPFGFDPVEFMMRTNLTPYHLGEGWVFEGGVHARVHPLTGADDEGLDITAEYAYIKARALATPVEFSFDTGLPYQPFTGPQVDVGAVKPAFFLNGQPYWPPESLKKKNYRDYVIWVEKTLYILDRLGRIDLLVQIPEALARMRMWGQIAISPKWDERNEPRGLTLLDGSVPISIQPWFNRQDYETGKIYGQTMNYLYQNYHIDVAAYWQGLLILSEMERSKYLVSNREKILDAFYSSGEIQAQFDSTLSYFLYRQQNALAQGQVASYFGVGGDQIARRPESALGSSQWKIL